MSGLARRVRGVAVFLYDFLVGDDWQVAVLVVVAMAVTAVLAHHGFRAWWIILVALGLALPYTVWRGARGQKRAGR